jgi:hypothetical protein
MVEVVGMFRGLKEDKMGNVPWGGSCTGKGVGPGKLKIAALGIVCRKNTCCAWAGGTFFPVVLLCQFLVLAENRFWFYILMYLEYNTVVVLC